MAFNPPKIESLVSTYINKWLSVATDGHVKWTQQNPGGFHQFKCSYCGKHVMQKADSFGTETANLIPWELQEWVKEHKHEPKVPEKSNKMMQLFMYKPLAPAEDDPKPATNLQQLTVQYYDSKMIANLKANTPWSEYDDDDDEPVVLKPLETCKKCGYTVKSNFCGECGTRWGDIPKPLSPVKGRKFRE